MPLSPRRREFLAELLHRLWWPHVLRALLSHPPHQSGRPRPPSPVTLGIMGLQRGLALAKQFRQLPKVQIKYLCDPDERRVAAAQLQLQSDNETPPLGSVTSDASSTIRKSMRWCAPLPIIGMPRPPFWLAKPVSMSMSKSHAAIVRGKGNRWWQQHANMAAWCKWGLSDEQSAHSTGHATPASRNHRRVYHARATYFANRESIGKGQSVPVPPELDYDLWQGPAPRRPYLDNLVHYHWHWRWHWGNGEIGEQWRAYHRSVSLGIAGRIPTTSQLVGRTLLAIRMIRRPPILRPSATNSMAPVPSPGKA